MTTKDLSAFGERLCHSGMELGEITPNIVGGDPLDPQNKVWLTRPHIEVVRYWNRLIRELRDAEKDT